MDTYSSIIGKSVDALFVTNPTNIRYLTGFSGVSPTEREAFALVTRETVYLFTNALYRESATALEKPGMQWKEIGRDNPVSQELARLCIQHHIPRLGFEDENLTVSEHTKIGEVLADRTLVPCRNHVETMRIKKTPSEIKHIRLAAKLTDRCFEYIRELIKPGITESYLTSEISSFFREFGAENAFSPIVAFGKNTAMPHYGMSHISKTVCQKNDIILLDFGARVSGYCADMTRMVFVGRIQPEWKHAYEAVLQANTKAIDLLKNGERNGATLDAAAQEVIAEEGFPVYPHSLGHAVGLDIHEAPRITVKKEETLMPSMAITIEPGTYIEGSYGIRIEDLILLTDNTIDILSHSPKELIHI